MERANRFRRKLPALYNPMRLFERPIPPTTVENEGEEEAIIDMPNERINNNISDQVAMGKEQEEEGAQIENNENEEVNDTVFINVPGTGIDSSQNDVKPTISADDLAAFGNLFDSGEIDPLGNSLGANGSASESNIENVHERHQQDIAENFVENQTVAVDVDIQNEISSVQTEASAIDNQTDCNIDEINNEDEARNAIITANTRAVVLNGENVVVDEDLEYLHIPGQKLQAIQCEAKYETKMNDTLCGNRPFKENVCILITSPQIRLV